MDTYEEKMRVPYICIHIIIYTKTCKSLKIFLNIAFLLLKSESFVQKLLETFLNFAYAFLKLLLFFLNIAFLQLKTISFIS